MLYDAIHEKTDFTTEQPIYSPKVPPNSIFTVILSAWIWIPMQTVLCELEMILQLPRHRCRNNLPNSFHCHCSYLCPT